MLQHTFFKKLTYHIIFNITIICFSGLLIIVVVNAIMKVKSTLIVLLSLHEE